MSDFDRERERRRAEREARRAAAAGGSSRKPASSSPAPKPGGTGKSAVPAYARKSAPPPPPPRRFSPFLLVIPLVVLGALLIWAVNGLGGDDDATPTPVPTEIASLLATSTPTITPIPTETPIPTATTVPSPTATVNPGFTQVTVCIDPGHGGDDRGYQREGNDVLGPFDEADLNLEVSMQLRDRLEADGFKVILLRTSDAPVNAAYADVNKDGYTANSTDDPFQAEHYRQLDELGARIIMCNANKGDLLISVHANGYPDVTAEGYEVWYTTSHQFGKNNARIAELIFTDLGEEYARAGFDAYPRGVFDDTVSADVDNPEGKLQHYVMIGPEQSGVPVSSYMPGVIVETGFVTNDGDALMLTSPDGKTAIVTAIDRAVVTYFEEILGQR